MGKKMEKLCINNKICLYINHQQLITEMYRKYTQQSDHYYTLKKDLFNFQAKDTKMVQSELETSTTQDENLVKVKRKRKKSKTTDAEAELYQQLKPFLLDIQKKILNCYQNLNNITRVWEENCEFPQFKGCNNLEQFQIVTFDGQDFLIPPLTCFFNYDIKCLPELVAALNRYDLIVMDMPWHNKYIRRLKRAKRSLAYKMLDIEELKAMPITQLMHSRTIVALWCTNSKQHQQALLNNVLPTWNLQLVHTLRWFKLNTKGDLIAPLKAEGFKQPYEILYITCHKDRDQKDFDELRRIDFILSVPSIIHSHKPPLYDWLKHYMPDSERSNCLELFARYLQPHFTSIGLEVLRLMDTRLFNKVCK